LKEKRKKKKKMAFDLVLEKWVEFRQVEIVNKQNVKIGGKK